MLITTFPLAACLAETLRVNMALLGQTRLALSGQDDQKSRIFQYFTSPQFHDRMATIAEQFEQMQADLAREKAAMNRTWAKRENRSKPSFRARQSSPASYRHCTALPCLSCRSSNFLTKPFKSEIPTSNLCSSFARRSLGEGG